MKWVGQRESDNVEVASGGLGRMVPIGGVGTLVIGLIIYFLTGDPSAVLNAPTAQAPGNAPAQSAQQIENSPEKHFVSVVLADTEDVWGEVFRRNGRHYRNPKLVLFSGAVQSACGLTDAATGPFYCPNDEKLYLDLSFFHELDQKYGAPGDFAQAYVIAHEIGHHVQKQLGTMQQVQALEERGDERQHNALSVRLELQADYYAGVWAHYAQQRKLLDAGDEDEALRAASAVGDDRLQQAARGYVVPDSFTHGSSQQRAYWFKRGFEAGDLDHGNTFAQ